MTRRVTNRLKFLLERLILRGPQYRLLVIIALIGLMSVVAGAIVHYFDAGVEGTFADAIWWAFLRLSDPGYLGDDRGTLQRLVSTILTVLGYVVFLGALVAIMTQWLNERMRALEAGLTPITQANHIILLGWTNRSPSVVRELVLSEDRVQRFLRLRGARRLRIAILTDTVTTALRVELRDRLGVAWDDRQVILRTGSPLRIEHLRRVDFVHAAAVIVPAADFAQGGPAQADTRTIKTLQSISHHPLAAGAAELPLAVAEIFDARKMPIAVRAYDGPVEILASDAIVSRLIAQNVRHRGVSHVYGEVLTHGHGNEIYIREAGPLAGKPFGSLQNYFPNAIVIGLVRVDGKSFQSELNPSGAETPDGDDRIALLARSYDAITPALKSPEGKPVTRQASPALSKRDGPRRVLLLGWNHKVPALLREFDSYAGERFAIDVVADMPAQEQRAALMRHDFAAQRLTAEFVEGDYTSPSLLRRIEPGRYDNIVLLGTDTAGSGEESDARSIVAYLLLGELLPREGGPSILVELLDEANLPLFRHRAAEVIVSPRILSHMLAQVALRRELRAVYDELFGPAGSEIAFRTAAIYGLAGVEASFRDVAERARSFGEIALGVRPARALTEYAGGIALNPARDRRWTFDDHDEIIVVANGVH